MKMHNARKRFIRVGITIGLRKAVIITLILVAAVAFAGSIAFRESTEAVEVFANGGGSYEKKNVGFLDLIGR